MVLPGVCSDTPDGLQIPGIRIAQPKVPQFKLGVAREIGVDCPCFCPSSQEGRACIRRPSEGGGPWNLSKSDHPCQLR